MSDRIGRRDRRCLRKGQEQSSSLRRGKSRETGLSDDEDGSRHQRFIIALRSGQTLLVAHNIDIAPRIASLREGDVVRFSGVYEWNEKGGVIHWTHRDPNGLHAGGWLSHNGQTYR